MTAPNRVLAFRRFAVAGGLCAVATGFIVRGTTLWSQLYLTRLTNTGRAPLEHGQQLSVVRDALATARTHRVLYIIGGATASSHELCSEAEAFVRAGLSPKSIAAVMPRRSPGGVASAETHDCDDLAGIQVLSMGPVALPDGFDAAVADSNLRVLYSTRVGERIDSRVAEYIVRAVSASPSN